MKKVLFLSLIISSSIFCNTQSRLAHAQKKLLNYMNYTANVKYKAESKKGGSSCHPHTLRDGTEHFINCTMNRNKGCPTCKANEIQDALVKATELTAIIYGICYENIGKEYKNEWFKGYNGLYYWQPALNMNNCNEYHVTPKKDASKHTIKPLKNASNNLSSCNKRLQRACNIASEVTYRFCKKQNKSKGYTVPCKPYQKSVYQKCMSGAL